MFDPLAADRFQFLIVSAEPVARLETSVAVSPSSSSLRSILATNAFISMREIYRGTFRCRSGKKTVDGIGNITDSRLMLEKAHLLALADEYRRVTEVSDTTLSSRMFNDGKKLSALRIPKGDLSTKRFNVAMRWFADNWPEGAVWPAHVTRPKVAA